MFHAAGTANVFACTSVGAHQVVLPRFDADAVLRAIERERISHTALVPTMLATLLDAPGFSTADLSSLRNMQYAASPISPELQRRVLERLDCEIAQFYGKTEASPTVSRLSPEDHRRPRRRLVPLGGRCVRRRPGLPLHGRPAQGHDHQRRRERLQHRGGGCALLAWRGPRSGDFGVPHEKWGESVHAVVAASPGAEVTEEELIAHCRRSIAGFKVPRSIDLQLEALPKSGAGKILKNRLREPFWAALERHVG
jgi:acyl-CoA synthetase (AMP-forming)/AMP-acid ligase II